MFRSFMFAVFLALTSVTIAADEIKAVTLEVQGMNCAACPITVKKALKKVPGVAEVTVDYKADTAEVIYDAGKVSPDELAKATTAAGYQMTYAVKEIFFTLQGEGANTGRAAVFCRFAGCNLWSGQEKDRATAVCNFCDTEFVGVDGVNGGKYRSAEDLAAQIERIWLARDESRRFVVCTGGEPLLQMDCALTEALHARNFVIAVETNGTVSAPAGLDWICVSPKAGSAVVQRNGDELKLVFPQSSAEPSKFEHWDFEHFFLQPMDGPQIGENTRLAVLYCMEYPKWWLSLQTHKFISIP